MLKDSDMYSVVILGSMNPRIHHPKWYQLAGIFTEADVESAIKTYPVVCTPSFSQFCVDGLVIKCLPERWDITTQKAADVDRIREIAEKIFDDLLPHTPVNIIALNFDYVRQASGENATGFMTAILNGAAAKIGLPSAEGGDLILKRRIETIADAQGLATIAIRSTDHAETVSLCCNYQYTMKSTVFALFRMDRFLPGYAKRDRADSEDSLARLLSAIRSTSKD
jgi:hypothetical protein